MRELAQTYAITLVCCERMRLLQREANATLLVRTLFRYRDGARFRLHAFVVMPDHVHLLLSPSGSLEQAVGLVKGGFSFAVRQQYRGPVWQAGYYAHRVIDGADYGGQAAYIERNPERKGWREYAFVSGRYAEQMDGRPEHLGV